MPLCRALLERRADDLADERPPNAENVGQDLLHSRSIREPLELESAIELTEERCERSLLRLPTFVWPVCMRQCCTSDCTETAVRRRMTQ